MELKGLSLPKKTIFCQSLINILGQAQQIKLESPEEFSDLFILVEDIISSIALPLTNLPSTTKERVDKRKQVGLQLRIKVD